MKKNLSVYCLFVFVLMTHITVAQDIIIKTDGTSVNCKIKEIGLDEVKYTLPDYSTDVTFSVDKENISKITFANGKEIIFKKELTNPANYETNRKNAFKTGFLSPLFGYTSIGYERSLKPGRSVEGTLGLIGMGIAPDNENPQGAFLKLGYKFIKDPDYYLRGMRYSHLLKGSYIKPEIGITAFSRNEWQYDEYYPFQSHEVRKAVVSAVIQLVIGKQWIFDNAFLVDIFGGVGYGFSTNWDLGGYHYGYVLADSKFPLALSSGLRIGFLTH